MQSSIHCSNPQSSLESHSHFVDLCAILIQHAVDLELDDKRGRTWRLKEDADIISSKRMDKAQRFMMKGVLKAPVRPG